MNIRVVRFLWVLSPMVAVVAAACSSSNPTQPSASSTTTASNGSVSSPVSLTGSVTAPRPLQPVNGAPVRNVDQPVTLIVQNAVVTKAGGTTYTFEIATDEAFGSKVQTKDGVAEGSGGQTSVTLDTLAASTDYYWHARARSAGTTGVFSATYKFTMGPAIVINAPVPIGPLNGAQTGPRPAFRVTNAIRTGPAGPITYKFEIATASTFSSIIVTGMNTEGINETGFIPTADLPLNASLFWRATAIDATNGFTSAPSAVQSFTARVPSAAEIVAAKLGVPLWPGVQPSGTNGRAVMGGNWQVQTVRSFDGVTFVSPTLEELQIFDLLDRGFDPNGAIGWMRSNGYQTTAAWYPNVAAIGFPFQYMALINGQWALILRVGA